jgi:hypothetical protein
MRRVCNQKWEVCFIEFSVDKITPGVERPARTEGVDRAGRRKQAPPRARAAPGVRRPIECEMLHPDRGPWHDADQQHRVTFTPPTARRQRASGEER